MKQRILLSLGIAIALVLLVGCTTIMKGGEQKVSFQSAPSGAKVTVYDDLGKAVSNGTTPFTLTLEKGNGYFQAAKYRVVIESNGYQKKEIWLKGSLETGWYVVGNMFLGGFIGWLIVDPLTGAMWTLKPEKVDATLDKGVSSIDGGLRIVLAEQVSPEMLAMATPIDANAQ